MLLQGWETKDKLAAAQYFSWILIPKIGAERETRSTFPSIPTGKLSGKAGICTLYNLIPGCLPFVCVNLREMIEEKEKATTFGSAYLRKNHPTTHELYKISAARRPLEQAIVNINEDATAGTSNCLFLNETQRSSLLAWLRSRTAGRSFWWQEKRVTYSKQKRQGRLRNVNSPPGHT